MMTDEPRREGCSRLRHEPAPTDLTGWLSQDWGEATPKLSPTMNEALIDGYNVAIIATVMMILGAIIWTALWILKIDVLSGHGVEYALALAGSTFALCAFLLAR